MITLKSLMSFWKGKSFIGLDLGSYYLKVVQLEKTDGSFRLVKKNILNVRELRESRDLSIAIQNFLGKKGYSGSGSYAVNIENPTLLIRRMELPKMPERDVLTAISWNFREHVDGSIDNYKVCYSKIKGLSVAEKIPVSAYCVSRQSVQNIQELMKDAGVRLSSIEPNTTALLAIFNHTVDWFENKSYVMIDLGYSVSNFVVMGNGSILYSRPLGHLNGRRLLTQVAKNLAVEEVSAEDKLNEVLSGLQENDSGETGSADDEKKKIMDNVSQFVSELVIEVQRSIDAFCLMYKRDRVDRIFLCGGGIRIPEIGERFAKGLGVPAETFNPFAKIIEVDESVYSNIDPMYAVAVGLALPRE